MLELEALERDAVLQPVHAGDAVADLEDGADLGEVGLDVVLLDPLLQDRRFLRGVASRALLVIRGRVRGGGAEAAAHARVDAQRAGLEHDPADQAGVDLAGGLDGPPGGLLDLADDRGGLVVWQLERRQLDGEAPGRVDERLQLLPDPRQLGGASLDRDEPDE